MKEKRRDFLVAAAIIVGVFLCGGTHHWWIHLIKIPADPNSTTVQEPAKWEIIRIADNDRIPKDYADFCVKAYWPNPKSREFDWAEGFLSSLKGGVDSLTADGWEIEWIVPNHQSYRCFNSIWVRAKKGPNWQEPP